MSNKNSSGKNSKKILTVADAYKAKVYLLSTYPQFRTLDFVVHGGSGTVTVGGNTIQIKHSLNHTTVQLAGYQAIANKNTLELTPATKDGNPKEKYKLTEAICTYVHMYQSYCGML